MQEDTIMAIYATITVDWEGYDLDDDNIEAMLKFNTRFQVPITHFICPAYFTRSNFDIPAAVAKINSAIQDKDEVALHIHSWSSLVACSGIQPITQPTYLKNDLCIDGDCGYSVPLGCYSVDQIRQILIASKQMLIDAGVKNTGTASAFKSFRCGGWLASDNVLNAAQQAGFTCEASGASSDYYTYLNNQLPVTVDEKDLMSWVALIWSGNVQSTPQYLMNNLNVKAYPGGVTGMCPMKDTISDPARMVNDMLIQIPDTGSLADYTSESTLQTYIDAAVKQQAGTGKDVFISMGFHQESAVYPSDAHPKVANISVIINVLKANLSKLTCVTVSQAAQKWQGLPVPIQHPEEELVRHERPVTFPHIPVAGKERRRFHG
jgi:hypothetical protein